MLLAAKSTSAAPTLTAAIPLDGGNNTSEADLKEFND